MKRCHPKGLKLKPLRDFGSPPEAFLFWGDPMAEERAKRKLSAILSADVKGYSRLMGEDEVGTVRTLKEYRELMSKLIKEYVAEWLILLGTMCLRSLPVWWMPWNVLLRFKRYLKNKNAALPNNRKMEFRIGVNLGDVIEDEDRVYGDGVNIAARIEGLAEPGGICISGSGFEQVRKQTAAWISVSRRAHGQEHCPAH